MTEAEIGLSLKPNHQTKLSFSKSMISSEWFYDKTNTVFFQNVIQIFISFQNVLQVFVFVVGNIHVLKACCICIVRAICVAFLNFNKGLSKVVNFKNKIKYSNFNNNDNDNNNNKSKSNSITDHEKGRQSFPSSEFFHV